MADTPPEIDRINALTVNARNTWFVLLGALIFVGVTLMSVEHIDFYGVDRATTLPVVNFDVPTRYFFVAAPILIAAIYGYFHLYLIRLWDALSDAEPTVNERPLGDVIAPWLITDAALYLRTQLRDEAQPSARHRLLEGSAMALNFAIAWAFGLIVLFFLWWLSMPARTFWMTLIAGLSLFAATFVGATSLAMLVARMKQKQSGPQGHVLATVPAMSAMLVALPLVLAFSHQRTEGSTGRLAPLVMIDQEIVDRPDGWVPYALAKLDFYESWCKRAGRTCAPIADVSDEQEQVFLREFRQRRDIARSDITKPSWSQFGATKPDFRGAEITSAFLVGANLIGAQMEGADLSGARMEGANLSGAQMEGADLSGARMEGVNFNEAQMKGAILSRAQMDRAILVEARMEGADLSGAQMKGANLYEARMEGADLSGAQLEGANLIGARMEEANFLGARMREANLRGARMDGAILIGVRMDGTILSAARMESANLSGAQMKRADLSGAQMEGADLSRAQMEGANLALSHFVGLASAPIQLTNTNLSAITNYAGALRFMELTNAIWDEGTDFRNTFLDGTVAVSAAFRNRMGNPCQWVDAALGETEFYALWRWWIRETGSAFYVNFSPPDYLNVPDATPELLAKYNLTDCKPDQPFGPMPTD